MSVPEVDGLLEDGVPLRVGGVCVGGVGVSGMKPNQDTQIATAGAAALTAP